MLASPRLVALFGRRELVVNGSFDAGLTGWTDASTAPSVITITGGVAVFTVSGANLCRLRQAITTKVGVSYILRNTSPSGITLAIGTSAGGTQLSGSAAAGTSRAFTATTTTTWINYTSSADGSTLDDVSVRRA